MLSPSIRNLAISCAIFSLLIFVIPEDSHSADIGNCLLCHKYPGLSRVDEKGNLRLLYINEKTFNSSVHSRVKCEDCHTDIKKIPHDTAKKVDCLTECHITEPSTEKKFSHKEVQEYLDKSVHSIYDKKGGLKEYPEDMPTCKKCHDNPLFRPLSFFKGTRYGISEDSMSRCRVCHKKEEFIVKFYNHVTGRLHRIRNPQNIAETCARCHDNPDLVSKYGLSTKAVFSYGETFHGKAAKYLDERIPDCLDCHVNKGESVHQMLSHNDPRSSTYKKNKGKICSNVDCHP
ncbi:MAG TPA: cytochrome C, partial [Nitrospirae bacterium]|nr:cytochrome C [Nitrospirota bacterium]